VQMEERLTNEKVYCNSIVNGSWYGVSRLCSVVCRYGGGRGG
jgi:hypothetical protein